MSDTFVLLLLGACSLTVAQDFKRTIIAIEKPTTHGEYMFLRGGSTSGQKLSIRHNVEPTDETSFFAQTSKGDSTLTWSSYESGQGVYREGWIVRSAEGTPMMWTTDDESFGTNVDTDGAGYWELNTEGSGYWVVDVDMDCSATQGGWFAFKGYLIDLYRYKSEWEGSYINQYSCDVNGTRVNVPGAQSWNHYGICGFFNIVRWNDGKCMAQEVAVVEQFVEVIRSPPTPELLAEI
ncbi:alpha-amylase-like [Haliotis rubra]|uniref:alpha-amylase-like n=1 Tax=Haliotis rubra TaxID=36100 RepID=UPI001EE5DE5D|nr:alpha-amylase-like [Haliotis rubra]